MGNFVVFIKMEKSSEQVDVEFAFISENVPLFTPNNRDWKIMYASSISGGEYFITYKNPTYQSPEYLIYYHVGKASPFICYKNKDSESYLNINA